MDGLETGVRVCYEAYINVTCSLPRTLPASFQANAFVGELYRVHDFHAFGPRARFPQLFFHRQELG